jgi:hypothetical protein
MKAMNTIPLNLNPLFILELSVMTKKKLELKSEPRKRDK